MNRLTLLADVNACTGFGKHGIQIVSGIENLASTHVAIRALSVNETHTPIPMWIRQRLVNGVQPESWELILSPPVFSPTHGKRTAYVTAWETTQLPKASVRHLNEAEVVIVPSAWNESVFSACGVRSRIVKVPLGVDPEFFHYRTSKDRRLCVFGTAGWVSQGGRLRKGIQDVITAFKLAFPTSESVRLRIHCLGGKIDADDPRIEITSGYRTERKMADWYSDLTCFVSGSRAEGWGLMLHEAMAIGRPVIGVDFGGVCEFFNADNGYPVAYDLVDAEGGYSGNGRWAKPDLDSMVARMLEVYETPMEAFEKGLRASNAVRKLTWLESNRNLIGVLRDCGALPAESPLLATSNTVEEVSHGVIAYLPPVGVGHTDVFLKNLEEHPPKCPVVFITDGDWPGAERIEGVSQFKTSDDIGSYVFLKALLEAKRRGWKRMIYLETDCRVYGEGWDEEILKYCISDKAIVSGNMGFCNFTCHGGKAVTAAVNILGISPTKEKGLRTQQVIEQESDSKLLTPFVNGAPAVYQVGALMTLVPARAAELHVKGGFSPYDRAIGEQMVSWFGTLPSLMFIENNLKIMATAGEEIYPPDVLEGVLTAGEVKAVHPIKNRWRPWPKERVTFYHSGDLGDIIYSLKAIWKYGGGHLILGPECKTDYPPRCPMTPDLFYMLLPLLKCQGYLKSIQFSATYPRCTHDLNGFRTFWNERTQRRIQIDNLCEMHCYYLGVESHFDASPWMEAGEIKQLAPAVIHRSARYQSTDYPWREIVDRIGSDAVFIGSHEEHKAFCDQFGKVAFYQVRDFLDMANVIKGARAFVGNQSLPCAIAIALADTRVFQETFKPYPDCLFNRAGFYSGSDTETVNQLVSLL